MSSPDPSDQEGLPPAGSRWGTGAQSVLPYLARTLKAKPESSPEAREHTREGHPVFANWPPRSN